MPQFRNLAIVLWLLAGVGLAQNAEPTDQETIRLLVQQVKELQEKVKTLEAGQAPSTAAPEKVASVPSDLAAPSASLQQVIAATESLHELHGIQWRGFGEVNYKVLDQRQPELGTFGSVPGSAGNFFTGDFDLFLTSRINDRTSVLSEIVIGEGDAQSFSVDLERVLLKYDYDDHLKMSFGRYHTGIGYYNTAFHSGK